MAGVERPAGPGATAVLEQLTISGLGVITDADLEFDPGLTVVTGETGAGKTMVVTALGLLLGERADTGLVRRGASRARVEGRLRIPTDSDVAGRAAEAGAELDEDTLIVGRTVRPEGRSRATAGGVGVPVGTLGALTRPLVTVHGQSDQQQLLSPQRQRAALDRFGGEQVDTALTAYSDTFQALRRTEAELAALTEGRRQRAQEADLLRLGLTEVREFAPEPGEEQQLATEESRLVHAESLRQQAEEARQALSGRVDDLNADVPDALSLVAQARKALESVAVHDPAVAALADRVAEASYLLTDCATELASYSESIETDPARLEVVTDRRARLQQLLRKYGDTAEEVLAWAATAETRMETLTGDDDRILALEDAAGRLRADLAERSGVLSAARRDAANGLAERVTAELQDLAMAHQRFTVQIAARPEPGPEGADDVTFCLASDGDDARPLQRVASGGELSRVMLALEVSLAGTAAAPTYVFDEVDAGVGGRAAIEVGRRLARLARHAQVIVVTHLPQVAAFADRHYAVVKDDEGTVSASDASVLDDGGRRRELSRMLAGMAESRSAHAHAEELLEMGLTERAG